MPLDIALLSPSRSRPTRAETLANDLAAAITSGALPPGTTLEEEKLAAAHGVSRTPVREALRLLGATGLVEQRPRRGAVVARPEPKRLREMFQAMAELEAVCAGMCAERMSASERRDLLIRHESMSTLVGMGDVAGYRAANVGFHEALYAGAANGYLAELAEATRLRLAPFRAAQLAGPDRLAASHTEHAAIVAGILAGDREGAAVAMRRHLATTESAWGLLAGLPAASA